ncbi:MAG: sterol desaturase family protein [Candidatus Abyssubacteria bacterium]
MSKAEYFRYLEPAALGVVFLALLVFDFTAPLRARKRKVFGRFFTNFWLSLGAFVVGTAVVKPVSRGLAEWTSLHSFGVLYAVPMSAGVRFVAGFLLMDLSFYYWHRLNHEVPLLWRFHNVHHVDPDLDVTTSFRFHFGEILYSTVFRVVQVGLIGLAPLTYIVYEFLFQAETMFHHSNVRLPIRVERLLNKVIVTPRMHGIHHSVVRDETNSNYSVIFRWWDLLHRTLRLNVPQSGITIGIPAYLGDEDNNVVKLLALPFKGQRDYWHSEDGAVPQREPTTGEEPFVLAQ